MDKEKKHLPIFGIGPILIIILLVITFLAILFNYLGYFNKYRIDNNLWIYNLIGFVLILEGLILWIFAVIITRIDTRIKENKLVTSGVYRYVRNPIYSSFLFVFSGIIILNKNYLLLILPFVYWLSITLVMKKTEEKWLINKFKKEYENYCKSTNRCLPFFPRNKK